MLDMCSHCRVAASRSLHSTMLFNQLEALSSPVLWHRPKVCNSFFVAATVKAQSVSASLRNMQGKCIEES